MVSTGGIRSARSVSVDSYSEALDVAAREAAALVVTAGPTLAGPEMSDARSANSSVAEMAATVEASLERAIAAVQDGHRVLWMARGSAIVRNGIAPDSLVALARTEVRGALVVAATGGSSRAANGVMNDPHLWARSAQLPVLEPADPRESYEMARSAFALSEEFVCPVLIRFPDDTSFLSDPQFSVNSTATEPSAAGRNRQMSRRSGPGIENQDHWSAIASARQRELSNFSNTCELNILERGRDRRIGFIVAGANYHEVKSRFPDAPILKLGLSYPLPMKHVRGLSEICRTVIVVEGPAALTASELKDEGIDIHNAALAWGSDEPWANALEAAVDRLRTRMKA